ncbi:DHA2 family efflux MFS transporter permease subunit [Desulfomonile tiedjei]|uniref:Drug resistance transporter, EmrB/QacA subfamily n=1 Tax=Desulfomonile tiedjei (strain ATCC 49306 / DSM 6799 / DCB-1) TaxID=706587 RepID=I4C5H1_DESTA|nr:DHA2 family efflux MFS transporter permease subunit [Desulfomonile tiedjei]AFM24812.1 drug resistance transporter, EmrB/QacA subfamily [Desulfomonile tiedjei DSM 6799]
MDRPQTNKWLITLAVMLPTLIEILDTSVANVALPYIQGSLSAGQDEVTWVLTSYLVSNAIVIPMSGWFARVFGRKKYLLISIVIFTVSSVFCGWATGLGEIVTFRILQGIGGGGLQPMSQAILLETFPAEERGLAMGIFGMGAVLGPILGPLVGGYLTDNYSWRWIFYINLPIGILALGLITAFIFDPAYQERRNHGEKIDYVGITLLSLGLGSLQVVLDKGQREDWFESNFIVVLTTISVVSLITLIFWELRQERPILDLRIFKDRSFATANLVMFLTFFAFLGSIVLLPLYLQTLMGYTAFLAGQVLGLGGVFLLVLLPLAGKLTERIDARYLLAVGAIITSYSLYYMSGFNGQIDFHSAIMGRFIQTLGMPFIFVAVTFAAMAYVPQEQMNNASAIFNLLRNLGGSFGVAFVSTMIQWRSQFHQARLIENLTPFNPIFNQSVEQMKSFFDVQMGAFAGNMKLAQQAIYLEMQRQASLLAFNDVFFLEAVIMIALIGIIWIIRKPPVGGKSGLPSH